MNKKICHLFACIICIGLWSCEGNEPEPVYERCLLTKYYSQGDTSQTSINFFYDNNDRLVQMITPGPPGMVWGSNYIYGSNTITITDMASANSFSKYYLRADSLAYASVSYAQGVLFDTVTYFYNAEKYLIKTVRYNPVFGKDSSLFTYAENNLQRIDTYQSNGFVDYASFTYGNTPSKAWYYQNNTIYLPSTYYYPWFGKANSKLASSYSFTYNGNPQPVSVSYSLNASGYIKSMQQTHLGNSSTLFFEYSCR